MDPGESAMQIIRCAANCRWAMPTLFLRPPLWLEAEDYPWSCVRDETPRVLSSTDVCATCPDWELRRMGAAGEPLREETAHAFPMMVDWFGAFRPPHETD